MIGVFDSGIGGLTVLKEFLRVLPEYNYIYLGDNKRAPYGNKTQREIYRYTREAVDFLFLKGCSLIIIACNTASTQALRKIQREYLPQKYPDKKVLGVVIPTVEEIATKEYKRVGLIGTRSTVGSKKYEAELKKIDREIKLYQQACPLLVPLVEKGKINDIKTEKAIKKYLKAFSNKNIDALVLGCTHYPLIYNDIRKIIGSKIKIINPPAVIADKLKKYIKKHKELKLEKNKKRVFYTTGDTAKFQRLNKQLFRLTAREIKKIKL